MSGLRFIAAVLTTFGLGATAGFGATAAELAERFCVGCHGVGFSGGRALALAGGKWRHARDDQQAALIITNGIPNTAMPPFADALADAEKAALVDYIKATTPTVGPMEVPSDTVYRTQHQNFRVERIGTGYETPWSIAFLPDGRLLVSERAGRLRIVDRGQNSPPIQGIPKVYYRQDAGLLSIALHPDFAQNGWVYLSYAEPGPQTRTSMTKIVRGRIKDGAWIDQQVIWEVDARYYIRGDDHYGCRLRFIGDKLFFTIGERGNRPAAQDLSNPCGKIHRLEADGRIPIDNPYVSQPEVYPSVWSYGHRNPQGLTIDPRHGDIWSTEHGPMGGDELNHIQPRANYGWPLVTYGREHNGREIAPFRTQPGMVDAVRQWTPSLAVCPLEFSTSPRFPGWQNQFLVGTLRAQQLRRLKLAGDRVVEEEILLDNFGRIRDVATSPDGLIYLAVEYYNRPGDIVRLVPVNEAGP